MKVLPFLFAAAWLIFSSSEAQSQDLWEVPERLVCNA